LSAEQQDQGKTLELNFELSKVFTQRHFADQVNVCGWEDNFM